MLQKGLKWTFGLIALYLVVANATGYGKDVTATSSGAVSFVKSLQGR